MFVSTKNYGSAGGGGGGSGKIEYPYYMQTYHSTILTAAYGERNTAAGTSPFNVTVYDATADMSEVVDRFTELDDMIRQLDEGDMFDKALEKAIGTVDLVVEEQTTSPELRQALVQFYSGMADINAIMTSAYVVGLSNLMAVHADNARSSRIQYIMSAAQTVLDLMLKKIDANRSAIGLMGEVNSNKARAAQAYVQEKAAYDSKNATWKLSLYQFLGNLLASIGGGVTTPGGNVMEQPPMTPMEQIQVKQAEFDLAMKIYGPSEAMRRYGGGGSYSKSAVVGYY